MRNLPFGVWITYPAVRGSYQRSTTASLDSQISSPMTDTTSHSAITTTHRSVIGYVIARGGIGVVRYLRGLLRSRSFIGGHGRSPSTGVVLSVCEVKGRTQEGFDGEPKSGVALGESSLVLNIVIASHSVDNPMV